ncbi:MAG: histidinol dehydrogenase [Parvibaculales bacterium]
MTVRLNSSDPDFESRFEDVLSMKREQDSDVTQAAQEIINQIRENGDTALFALTEKYDRFALTRDNLAFSKADIEAAKDRLEAADKTALQAAADRIAAYHHRQRPQDDFYTDDAGVQLGHKWTPVSAAGLYVPGGTASYPSSVLMNAIPAKVAGVGRLVMVVPTPDGAVNDLVLAAADLAGVDEIYRIGGAQAVAALAYGTRSIAPVDVITGPGNAYVAAAKRLVFGQVGIDMVAGPSEILVVADGANDPDWIAADLLSQAEHDTAAQSILLTDDADFADAVLAAVDRQLASLPRRDIAGQSWTDFGVVITVPDLQQAVGLIDRLAPEHLELAIEDPQEMVSKITNAGAIFMGRYTPEAIGDYVAGPNHVLPTAHTARYASGLSVLDFMKRSSLVSCDADSLAAIGPHAVRLAEREGLDAHARSVSIRLNK